MGLANITNVVWVRATCFTRLTYPPPSRVGRRKMLPPEQQSAGQFADSEGSTSSGSLVATLPYTAATTGTKITMIPPVSIQWYGLHPDRLRARRRCTKFGFERWNPTICNGQRGNSPNLTYQPMTALQARAGVGQSWRRFCRQQTTGKECRSGNCRRSGYDGHVSDGQDLH